MSNIVIKLKDAQVSDIYDFFNKNATGENILFSEKSSFLNENLIDEIAKDMKFEVLDYSGKNYIELTSVHLETELHYDGITSPNKLRIPDYLLFEFRSNPKKIDEIVNFNLVDCVKVVNYLSEELRDILLNKKLLIKGMPNPARPDFPDTFSIKCLENNILRIHLPSRLIERLSIIDDWLFSKNENIFFRFEGISIEKTISVFFDIHNAINKSGALFKFMPTDGNFVIVNNKRVLHGRDFNNKPASRLLRRYQFISL